MAKDCSFDIVSEFAFPEVQNCVNQAMKEVKTRFDFKGSKSDIQFEKEELILISDDEFKLEQLKDVLINKLIKREIPTKNIQYGKIEAAAGGTVRQRGKLIVGIDKDNAKKITNLIKNAGLKVKTTVQDDQVRVSGKSRDDLQAVIAAVRKAELPIDVQFTNFRS